MKDRDKMPKPDWMTDEEFAWFKERTASLDHIRSDARADVEAYLASPAGRSTGQTAQGGFPTLLLTTIGRKSGEKRTTPAVFMRHGEELVVVGSLAGYDTNPAWVLNLDANPNCWVQLDFDKYTAVARDATEAERKALWPSLVKVFPAWGYFQMQTERPFPIKMLKPTGPA
ncbi:MAG TPA: nitroreductase/quinone reductase family protein [Steroidobacter sp.]|jgi:deazaflavin-dependent oxidoreductase (nitroreductase family)|nr:nitroreductase/quinone reductase family protein [Steroidobacteraceae bacterium]HLS82010.1 nitroreductase/quinone reductase family protein [Steroidobacter sp.]